MWDIPSPREELDRKTVTALEWVATLMDSGKISPKVAAVAIQAVWMATSGLTSEEIKDLVTNASQHCRNLAAGSH